MHLGPRGNQIVARAIRYVARKPSGEIGTKRNARLPRSNVLFTAFSVRRFFQGVSNFHWPFHFFFLHVCPNLLNRSEFPFLELVWRRDCTFTSG